jgi:hypothetical protein
VGATLAQVYSQESEKRCCISSNWLQLLCPVFADCAIVRALPTTMALRSLNLLRVWSITPSSATAGALLLILALFISNVEAWKPTTFFGRYQDDAVYFSSAQALAQHQGYILPSFPGKPLRPRFPILYPLLLSGVWKLDPESPEISFGRFA